MRELITTFGDTREVKVSNKDVAIDLSNARVDLVKVFQKHKPSTYKEKAIWVRLQIAIEQVYECHKLLKELR